MDGFLCLNTNLLHSECVLMGKADGYELNTVYGFPSGPRDINCYRTLKRGLKVGLRTLPSIIGPTRVSVYDSVCVFKRPASCCRNVTRGTEIEANET